MKLYSYFRSSTAYRVRIALALKGIECDIVPVNLVAGDQRADQYRALNPSQAVPTLVDGDFVLTQSLAILAYLDEIAPEPPLLHGDAQQKCYQRQIALAISTDIHPLTNLHVLQHVDTLSPDVRGDWYAHFARRGMLAVEKLLQQNKRAGQFVCGDQLSVADLCLVPQMYNMRRFNYDLSDYPLCRAIERNCLRLDAFQQAAPEMQADAPHDLSPIHGPHAPCLNDVVK